MSWQHDDHNITTMWANKGYLYTNNDENRLIFWRSQTHNIDKTLMGHYQTATTLLPIGLTKVMSTIITESIVQELTWGDHDLKFISSRSWKWCMQIDDKILFIAILNSDLDLAMRLLMCNIVKDIFWENTSAKFHQNLHELRTVQRWQAKHLFIAMVTLTSGSDIWSANSFKIF